MFILIACWAIGTGAFAQVSINANDSLPPLGMFHVDALGNTDGGLYTGDDVIVTFEGSVGIGTIPPPASTELLTVTDGGTPQAPKSPLRIVDGYQEGGRVLTSVNTNGDARWQDLPGGLSIPGEAYGFRNIPAQTIHEHVNNNTLYDIGFSFTANTSGFYIFEIRWWGKYRDGQSAVTHAILHYRLLKNGAYADEYETYVTSNGTDAGHFSTCFTLYSRANAGETFTMRARPSYYMDTEVNPATPWTQSKVNIWRLN
ncbi:MAG: hypothetical protein LBJ58_04870 [Tannerellaceae bacterium]|nr:hypothetical protein [Tannerellaceae bacterium]